MDHAPTTFGITNAHIVFNIPNDFTTKNVGIKPPLKSMVIKINQRINFFAISSFLDNAYAHGNSTNKCSAVPTNVYIIVFLYPNHISSLWKIRSYPAKVISTGHNHIFPELTAVGSLIDALTTKTKG